MSTLNNTVSSAPVRLSEIKDRYESELHDLLDIAGFEDDYDCEYEVIDPRDEYEYLEADFGDTVNLKAIADFLDDFGSFSSYVIDIFHNHTVPVHLCSQDMLDICGEYEVQARNVMTETTGLGEFMYSLSYLIRRIQFYRRPTEA